MEYEGLAGVIADYIKGRKRQKIGSTEKEDEQANGERLPGEPEGSSEQDVVFHHWLTAAAKRAQQIRLATHGIKFTHGDARGGSVLVVPDSQATAADYLSTATLKRVDVDAFGNAAALDVAKLLQLEFNGDSLAVRLKQDDGSALAPFSQSKEQLEEWVCGFKAALAEKLPRSHTLAKQIYFPVGEQPYHLLSPLFASSLAQVVYQRITDSHFSEEAKAINKAKKGNKYAAGQYVSYPNTALQNFGGSKPQNVSLLNSARGGKAFLFSSAPPIWQIQLKPPVNSRSIFDGEFDRRAFHQAQALQQYLLSIIKIDSSMEIRRQRAAYLNTLIDTLFNYAAEVQNLTQFAGWSAESQLKRDQQLWLDPYRNDPAFQEERAKGDWQLQIANDFAFWLKRKLKHEQLVFGEVEHQAWVKGLSEKLREFEVDLPEVSR